MVAIDVFTLFDSLINMAFCKKFSSPSGQCRGADKGTPFHVRQMTFFIFACTRAPMPLM